MTEVAIPMSSLAEVQEYAVSLAKSDLLPVAYRGKPANVLLAVESGRALGIPAIQAINSIHIINGTPALSANLMRALVQRAGHLIRVVGDGQRATATLVRKNDPSFEYKSEWDLARAKTAGLTGGNWAKHPAAMLSARATAEVCRQGAADVLMGFDYLPDEISEIPAAPAASVTVTAADLTGEVVEAEIVPDVPMITDAQMKKMQATFTEKGFKDRDDRLGFVALTLDREVASSKDLTRVEAGQVIEALDALADTGADQ